MIIPHQELSDGALAGLIESFVTREIAVSDLGVSVAVQTDRVRKMLNDGQAVILYEPQEQTFTIVFKDQVPDGASNNE